MPWSVKKSSSCPPSKPWACVKDSDGTIEGCHATKADAQAQQAALYANEPEARMTVTAARRRAGDKPDQAWYRIENSAEGASIWLYDEIGHFGVAAADFLKELGGIKAKSIDVHLNCPGGEVFDGFTMFNALRKHPAEVTVHVDGLAASIASVIAMAGDRVVMDRFGQMMIHESHAVAVGSAKEMTAMARLLDEYSDKIATVYAERAGGETSEWRERMRAETWYSADEAKKAGLVDEVSSTARETDRTPWSSWDLTIFNYAGRDKAPDPFRPLDMACPAHDTATAEGTWDASVHQGRLPSPMSLAVAKRFYGWIDAERVENGTLPKDAGKLPHHEVSADGSPGPANLNGVRAALSRLPQSDIPAGDVEAVRRHLRAHLGSQATDQATPLQDPPDEAGFLMPDIRAPIQALTDLDWDPDLFRAAVAIAAADYPAAPPTAPSDPDTPEPEIIISLPDLRRTLREARL